MDPLDKILVVLDSAIGGRILQQDAKHRRQLVLAFPAEHFFWRANDHLDPKRARLLTEVADAQQQAGDLDGAIASFQRSLAQDPSQPGVWSKLGIAYKAKDCNGCKNKAIEALLSAEKVDAKDWVAHRELGYLYASQGVICGLAGLFGRA